MESYTIQIDESERQTILLALAHLAVERPGWDMMLSELALKMDRPEDAKRRQVEALQRNGAPEPHVAKGKPVLFEKFKFYKTENKTGQH